MPFKKGDPKPPGSGLKKGQSMRSTILAKQAFQDAFEGLGGVDALIRWARDNKTEFYRHYARLIPHELTGAGGGPVRFSYEESFASAVKAAPKEVQHALASLTEEARQQAIADFEDGSMPVDRASAQ